MKTLLLPALAVLLTASPAHAQAPTLAPTQPNLAASQAIFRCTLPGGTYVVAVRSMISVSSHEYLIDGAARVAEVNIDTNGSLLARFYFIEPAVPNNTPVPLAGTLNEKAQQLLGTATEKTGVDAWKKVVKSYPTTTHARTVEYRVTSREQLDQIFSKADEALRLGKAQTVRIE